MRRRRLAVVVVVVAAVVVLYLCVPDRRAAGLKAAVDRVLDQAIAEHLRVDVPDAVYDLQDSLICTTANRCATNTTSAIAASLCTALVGRQVLFIGAESTYYLHTLWLDALRTHTNTNRSLVCSGPQFCTFHHVCGNATPTYKGRAVQFPNRDELLATNSCIIRYVRSSTLHAAYDAKDRAYTQPIVDDSTGVRVHNAYWLRHARNADVIVMNHAPLPAPVSTYERGNWTFTNTPVYVDAPVVNAAVHATLTRFLPSTVRALHVLAGLNSKKRPAVVWHGSWLMDAGCPDRNKKRGIVDWLNGRVVRDPWTLYYNAQEPGDVCADAASGRGVSGPGYARERRGKREIRGRLPAVRPGDAKRERDAAGVSGRAREPHFLIKPPLLSASFATVEMHFQRFEPSLTPPYQRETTTRTLSERERWRRRARRWPAPLSPPSHWPSVLATRKAYMRWVARLRAGRAEMWARAGATSAALFRGAACATNEELCSRTYEEAKTEKGRMAE
ncbi:hypothetical protein C0992_004700 [Termitomyces sp. T32_za158]|nr:hypothetical protein C0992_004700 [Termitomyces sp. T32_za158]